MRGPNAYNCTAGPNASPCRYCAMRTYRGLLKYREERGLYPLPEMPTVPAQWHKPGTGCPCRPCKRNRERVTAANTFPPPAKKTKEKKIKPLDTRKPIITEDEMDRRALLWLENLA